MKIVDGVMHPTFPHAAADGSGPARETIEVGKGEVAFDPSSTKRNINGPATVEYTRWADGGLDAKVL